jgi:hypothetical protein
MKLQASQFQPLNTFQNIGQKQIGFLLGVRITIENEALEKVLIGESRSQKWPSEMMSVSTMDLELLNIRE